jgi:hypothetical protein
MHGFDLLYSAWSLGLQRREFIGLLGGDAASPFETDWEKNHARDRSCFAQYRNNGFAAHRR